MLILGIDIGGTSIKSDLYNAHGQSQHEFKEMQTPVNIETGDNTIVEAVLELIQTYRDLGYRLDGVGISSAGIINSTTGEVVYSGPTIPNYKGTNLKKEIDAHFHLPCSVENDVNCAALAETWLGAGKGQSSAICLTVGTGIGGAVIIDGKVWRGYSHAAGEVGYLPVDGTSWQELASTTSLVKHYCELKGLRHSNGIAIFDAYEAGEEEAIQSVAHLVTQFVKGLQPLIYVINPEAIIIGGGIFHRSAILLPLIQEKMEQTIQNAQFMPRVITVAKLDNEAGRVGAVYHFLQQQCSPKE